MKEHELILTSLLNCDRTRLYVEAEALNPIQKNQYDEILKKRSAGEPLQYLIGWTEFFGLKFAVNPSVLIPRPETEILVEKTLARVKEKFQDKAIKILDLGTGSGNVAVTLAHHLPQADIVSVDVSGEAIEVAQKNARLNGVADRIRFICADMEKFLKQTDSQFDVIVSNPPYIPTENLSMLPNDVQREPRLALDGGPDGLEFYRIIFKQGLAQLVRGFSKNNLGNIVLAVDGFCMCEIGDAQDNKLIQVLTEYNPKFDITFHDDYTQRRRVAEITPTTSEVNAHG